jgi:hypothetical protein
VKRPLIKLEAVFIGYENVFEKATSSFYLTYYKRNVPNDLLPL